MEIKKKGREVDRIPGVEREEHVWVPIFQFQFQFQMGKKDKKIKT
jgi:hypothetical protein